MKAYRIFSILLTAALLLSFSFPASASLDPEPDPEREAYYDEDSLPLEERCANLFRELKADTDFEPWQDYALSGKLVLAEDMLTQAGNDIYLKSGSVFVIKNGASLEMMPHSSLVVERGAKLYVTDGSLSCDSLKNYGEIIIRKKGEIQVSDRYTSNGGSSVILQGEMYFGNTELSKIVKRIQNADSRFNLDDYCMEFYYRDLSKYARGALDAEVGPYFYYCIGDIITDFTYQYAGGKIIRKGCSPETAYDEETAKKLTAAAKRHFAESGIEEKLIDDRYTVHFDMDIRFEYSFRKKKMTFYPCRFTYDAYDDMVYDLGDIEDVKL